MLPWCLPLPSFAEVVKARWGPLQLKARIERPKQQVSITALSHDASHTDFMMTSVSGASSSILSSGTEESEGGKVFAQAK